MSEPSTSSPEPAPRHPEPTPASEAVDASNDFDFPLADPSGLARKPPLLPRPPVSPPAPPRAAAPSLPPAGSVPAVPAFNGTVPALASAAAPPAAALQTQAEGPGKDDPLAATVHLTAASMGAALGGPQRSYRWRDESGTETLLDRRDVIRLIRDGTLSLEDNLAEGGNAFKQAEEFEDLRRYFQMRMAPVVVPAASRSSGPLLGCGRHPQTHAAWCCGMCGSYWCDACAPPKRIANTMVTPCAHCSEPCMPVQAHVEVVPFWREIGSLFLYPVKGWGAAMWIMYSVILWLSKVVLSMGLLMLFAWACLNFFALTYCMLIVKDSAEGGRKVPDWPDFSQWWEIIGRGFRGFLCSIFAFLPLIVYGYLVFKMFGQGVENLSDILRAAGIFVIGAIPLLLFTAVYYPMVFLIASIFDTIIPALNPILIFKAIARIPFDYTIALIFIYTLLIAGAVLSFPFRRIPIIGGLPAEIVNAYFTFVWLHILGRMAHQNEEKLNWSV